ncbi:MAG: gamma-glutamyltransferase family protein, partial [Pseudomonadales bacterium]
LKFFDAVVGGRSVGTPGTVKLMQHMHDKHGVKPWKGLFTQAQGLASDGFRVSPRLASSIARDQQRLRSREDTLRYFFDRQGAPLQAGSTLKNPAYAHTLERLANEGNSAFYTGSIGADIVAKVQSDAQNPGMLSTEDLALYKVIERPAVCAPYLDYSVCGMGPPSSGALSVGQILGISSHFDLKQLGPENSTSWQIIGDASRLAFADRARYMADSDYVPMPQGLLDPDYLAARADLITPGAALSASAVSAGEPNWGQKKQIAYADDVSLELPSTSHFVIVDSQGNVLSMTTTIENGFGSRLMSNGFLLNNELTDFSFKTHSDGYPIANRLEPGKRPRSSMAPSIVMRDAKPVLAIGSPGGSRIIGYVANSLISLLTWELPLQEALNAPHLINRFGTYDLEANSNAENLQRELEQMGFNTKIRDLNSGLHAVQITPQGLVGAADPRREGTVMGE